MPADRTAQRLTGRVPLAEYAYLRLKAAIQKHELGPGTRIREVNVAEWLGISRTPIRAALMQLELEGLLETAGRRGLVVATLDEQRISEIYAIRTVLEGFGARLASQRASSAEVATMRRNVDRQRATPVDAVDTHIKLNAQFHESIYAAARNRYLVAALASLEVPLALLKGTTYTDPDRPGEAIQQHTDLVDAIEHHDEETAEAIAQDHVRAAERVRLLRLAEIDDQVDDTDLEGKIGA